jgi:hypothetical protein
VTVQDRTDVAQVWPRRNRKARSLEAEPGPPEQPHRAGVYVNFLDSDDDTSRVREAYGDDRYRRLAEVKPRTTQRNVFHSKNIQPGTPAH